MAVPSVDMPVPSVEMAVPSVEMAVPSVEMAVPSGKNGCSVGRIAVPSVDMAVLTVNSKAYNPDFSTVKTKRNVALTCNPCPFSANKAL